MTYLLRHPGEVAGRLAQHVELTLLSLALALVIAVPLGLLVVRKPRIGAAIMLVLNIVYTIPSLALFALLVPLLGIGQVTAIVALVAYAQMILVRNIATALREVPPAAREAARGIGMTPLQSFLRVELPLAFPAILAGIRVAVIALIAIATLAAWVNAGGLGVFILYGLEHDDVSRAVAGSVCAAGLAILAEWGLRALERRATARVR